MNDLANMLVNSISNTQDLTDFNIDNRHFSNSFRKCCYHILNKNEKQTLPTTTTKNASLLFEIDSVLDYLHDELNTGHWSEVPINTRRVFTRASFVKGILVLKNSEHCAVEILQESLKCLDLGLLLGAPLEKNAELLTNAAKILSEKISAKVVSDQPELKTPMNFNQTSDETFALQFSSIPGQEIETVECPSLERFNNHYFVKQVPVKLQGCMTHWPALTKWLDVNYLINVAGDRTVPVEIGSHYVDEDWSQRLMTLKEFISNHYLADKAEGSNIGYLAQHNLFDQITELKEDIHIPEYCCLSQDYENSTDPDINAWFGPRGTVSPLHQDPKNNILVQVYGTKQIILFSPEDTNYLYPHEDKLLSNTAQVDPLNPDLTKYPEFKKSRMFKCLLRPSEMLFIPVKWWHHVTALDKSFSVSFWWQ